MTIYTSCGLWNNIPGMSGTFICDISSAMVAATIIDEVNGTPDNSTITFTRSVLDPILAANSITLKTANLWMVAGGNNFTFGGWVKDITTSGKTYVVSLMNNLGTLGQMIQSTDYTSATDAITLMRNAMNGWGSGTLAVQTVLSSYDCNNNTSNSLMRDMIFANFSAGTGTIAQFAAMGTGLVWIKPWGTEFFNEYGLGTQNIGFNTTGLKLVAKCQKQDTKSMIINDVIVKYNGGSVEVSDATSIASYGKITRTYLRSNFNTSADALAFANGVLNMYKAPPVYIIATVINNRSYGFPRLGGTYNVTDQFTLGGTVSGLVCFKKVCSYPSGHTEMHLSNVPINILDATADVNSRLKALEDGATTASGSSFDTITLQEGMFFSGSNEGDILYNDGTKFVPLSIGPNGYILSVNTSQPGKLAWIPPSGNSTPGDLTGTYWETTATYIIYQTGSTYYAILGYGGSVVSSSTSVDTVFQYVYANIGTGTLFVRNGSYTGFTTALLPPSNTTTTLASQNCIFKMATQRSNGSHLFYLSGKTNVLLQGGFLEGDRTNQANAVDAIYMYGSNHITITNITGARWSEDGVYVGQGGAHCSYITMNTINFSYCHRNAFSLTDASYVTMNNCVGTYSDNQNYDFEPNNATDYLNNIVCNSCLAAYCVGSIGGGGHGIYITGVSGGSAVQHDITLNNFESHHNKQSGGCAGIDIKNILNVFVNGGSFHDNLLGVAAYPGCTNLVFTNVVSYNNTQRGFEFTYGGQNDVSVSLSYCSTYGNGTPIVYGVATASNCTFN